MSNQSHDFEGLLWGMGLLALHQAILWEVYYREAMQRGRAVSRWEFWLSSARKVFNE